MRACPQCGSPLAVQDMTGVTYLWPDETPFDPQPTEWACTRDDCDYAELRGLTLEQRQQLTMKYRAAAPAGEER